jgi:hypothetical protein
MENSPPCTHSPGKGTPDRQFSIRDGIGKGPGIHIDYEMFDSLKIVESQAIDQG